MRSVLFMLVLLVSSGAPAIAAPDVTLGAPVSDGFSTVDPGSIRVEMLDAGDFVDLQVSITVHPFCFTPIDIGLGTTGDGAALTNLTGTLVNRCGGDTSVFDIRLTGDGIGHIFDIEFLDLNSGTPLVSISVELFPGAAPVVTLGHAVTDRFSTVDPGSIRIDMFGAGDIVALRLSMTVHPVCIRPINLGLSAISDDGTFTDLTGDLVNNCGGDSSEFDITLSGDGLAHEYDIAFVNLDSGVPIASIPVALFPEPAPVVILGAPVSDGFSTVDPGSIRVEMLGAGNFVDLQVSITVHPFCITPIDIGLGTTGDGGTFADQTGVVVNGCGDDTSVFDIRLTGDGMTHAFDIDFIDQNTGTPLASIPVELIPGTEDTDSDGVPDLTDNCTLVANTDQRDTNDDGIGNACDPDLDNNCTVNFLDLGLMKAVFFTADGDADLDGNGSVNFVDLGLMKAGFFLPPGPSGMPNACE